LPHHDDHVERVLKLALFIAGKEGGDRRVIEIAAKFHDICRDEENHALKGAEKAREILKEKGYEGSFIEEVCHCIESHSFSGNILPRTLEAKILSDADKLDAIGAIGVARAFMFSGENGRDIESTLRHLEEKLFKLKDLLYTETAREIADERHKFMQAFYRRIKRELELKDISESDEIG